MNCQDDLTSLDLDAIGPSESLASASTGSSISLYPFIALNGSHASNIEDVQGDSAENSLARVLRPLDTKDVVLSNQEAEELENERGGAEGRVWRGGAIDSQEGDDEILVHVSAPSLGRRRRASSAHRRFLLRRPRSDFRS